LDVSTSHPMPDPPQPAAPAAHATEAGAATPAGRAARMIVVLCFAITALATALIYWRWANVTEPSSYVIVQGAADHNGTFVTVSSEYGTDVVATATLTPENQYAVTIFLHPGNYWLSAAQNGTKLVEGNMLVAHRRWKTVQLRSRTIRQATDRAPPAYPE